MIARAVRGERARGRLTRRAPSRRRILADLAVLVDVEDEQTQLAPPAREVAEQVESGRVGPLLLSPAECGLYPFDARRVLRV